MLKCNYSNFMIPITSYLIVTKTKSLESPLKNNKLGFEDKKINRKVNTIEY